MEKHKDTPEVSGAGETLPVRPANVPERAHYINERSSTNGVACWVLGQVDTRTGKYTGEYYEWDLNGIIIVIRVYNSENGEVAEEHNYENGKLRTSEVYTSGELLQSFYFRDIVQPVVRKTVLYRNNHQDRLQTFFNVAGMELYSIRLEKVSNHHERRYCNGVLVFEGIGNPDHAKAPSSVQYFYPGGATMINYTSHGDGTGLWRFYDEAGLESGNLPENNEKDKNKYNHWDRFMPSWSSYEHETIRTDWEVITENFKEIHKALITREKVYALVVPEHLKQALQKVDWEKIETAMGGGKKLPMAITGLLAEDEDVVAMCLDDIWHQIEHQGGVYEATYKVTAVLAGMLPYYTNIAVVQSRLLGFLFKVLGQLYLAQNVELYNELITALNTITPIIMQLANDADDLTALQAQYILIEAGRNKPETEALFIRERQRAENTRLRKAYAASSLGTLYLITKQLEKGIDHFSAAFITETDPLVRLVMAVYLVVASKKEARDPWLAELIFVLTDPDSVDDDFYNLQPFIGSYDVQEYVLMTLRHAKQEVLERNMDEVIATLPDADPLKQVTLFQAIFGVLFPNESALIDITPIRKKALLAAANVIDAKPNFVNHGKVFHEHNVPYDSYMLRRFAGV